MDKEQAAARWGLKPATVERAIKDYRVEFTLDDAGNALIPNDALPPLKKSMIQAILWAELRYKNDGTYINSGAIPGIRGEALVPAFRQLEFREYIRGTKQCTTLQEYLDSCIITQQGMTLVEKDRLPGCGISDSQRAGKAVDLILRVVALLADIAGPTSA